MGSINMKTIEELTLEKRMIIEKIGFDGGMGYVYYPDVIQPIRVVFSFGAGWDHVSASYSTRLLTWDEMNFLKDVFFHEDETVVQFHPPKKDYINNHPNVLHLWKPQDYDIALPPKFMV